MNVWDILILLAVAAIVLAAVRQIRKPRSGCCSTGCDGNCAGCGGACPRCAQTEQQKLEQ